MANTDLLAISELLDIKLAPIMETQTAMQGELTELKSEIGEVKAELKNDINELRSELKNDINDVRFSQTRTEILLENDVLPRLQNIEACYTDAYDKYSGGIAEIRVLKTDMSIMKNVLEDHA